MRQSTESSEDVAKSSVPADQGVIDLDDTRVAFAPRSTAELRRAQWLFRAFNSPLLMAVGPWLARAALAVKLPIGFLLRGTFFKHFCGGATIDDCDGVAAELKRNGVRSILDYSVEGLGEEKDFDAAAAEVLKVIGKAGREQSLPFAVFKVTGLGRLDLLAKVASGEVLSSEESQAFERLRRRIETLCAAAAAARRRILIDAEESWIQAPVDAIALDMMRRFNKSEAIVYNTLQMYRVDRLSYLHQLHAEARAGGFKIGIKLVRGAYMEAERERAAKLGLPSPIHPDKAATDQAFDAAVAYGIANLADIAVFVGTHNEASTRRLVALMRQAGIDPRDPRIEFSQLLGMGDHLSFNLARSGFQVTKYVPFGPLKAVMPYLIRRAEENSSLKGQAGRELQLIEQELRRREKSGQK